MPLCPHTYFSIVSAGAFLSVCLLGGIDLCFDCFRTERPSNVTLSRIVGSLLLLMSFSSACYMLADSVSPCFYAIGNISDLLIFVLVCVVGYVIYSNNQPSHLVLSAFIAFFVAIALLDVFMPSSIDILISIASVLLLIMFVSYNFKLRRREKSLGNIYSDPESHSLHWFRHLVYFIVLWIVLHTLFMVEGLRWLYDIVLYNYMTAVTIYFVMKVIHYPAPVSIRTQEEIEEMRLGEVATTTDESSRIRESLYQLFEDDETFLIPDLTIEHVAKSLGINVKYLSAVLNQEMNTSFSQYVNDLRIERAKYLLQSSDDKIANIAILCGFNHKQSFYRTFQKATGLTPSEWRSSNSGAQ